MTGMDLVFSPLQVASLGTFCFFMTFFGLLGNGTVLYSSVRYNAIRLDRVSLILVQNLAVADIIYTLCVILPQLITYVAGQWVLGKVYCFISAQISFIPGSANALTVLLITSYRLWLVTHPFSSTSKNKARIVVAITWVLASAGTVISLSYKSSSTFNPKNGKCTSEIYVIKEAEAIFKIAVGVIIMIPLLVITVENIILCVIAVKSSRMQENSKPNYKALVMVCALSGIFILSWVPYVIYSFMISKNPDVPKAVELLSFHCIYINAFANPILYTLTNRRFGEYVRSLLLTTCCFICRFKGIAKSHSSTNPTSTSNARPASAVEIENHQSVIPANLPVAEETL